MDSTVHVIFSAYQTSLDMRFADQIHESNQMSYKLMVDKNPEEPEGRYYWCAMINTTACQRHISAYLVPLWQYIDFLAY